MHAKETSQNPNPPKLPFSFRRMLPNIATLFINIIILVEMLMLASVEAMVKKEKSETIESDEARPKKVKISAYCKTNTFYTVTAQAENHIENCKELAYVQVEATIEEDNYFCTFILIPSRQNANASTKTVENKVKKCEDYTDVEDGQLKELLITYNNALKEVIKSVEEYNQLIKKNWTEEEYESTKTELCNQSANKNSEKSKLYHSAKKALNDYIRPRNKKWHSIKKIEKEEEELKKEVKSIQDFFSALIQEPPTFKCEDSNCADCEDKRRQKMLSEYNVEEIQITLKEIDEYIKGGKNEKLLWEEWDKAEEGEKKDTIKAQLDKLDLPNYYPKKEVDKFLSDLREKKIWWFKCAEKLLKNKNGRAGKKHGQAQEKKTVEEVGSSKGSGKSESGKKNKGKKGEEEQ